MTENIHPDDLHSVENACRAVNGRVVSTIDLEEDHEPEHIWPIIKRVMRKFNKDYEQENKNNNHKENNQ